MLLRLLLLLPTVSLRLLVFLPLQAPTACVATACTQSPATTAWQICTFVAATPVAPAAAAPSAVAAAAPVPVAIASSTPVASTAP